MKKVREVLLVMSFLTGAFLSAHAAGVTDFEDYCTGANQSNCPWKISSTGGVTMGGGIIQAPPTVLTTGITNLNTAANTAISFPVLVSTAVSQGMVIVATSAVVTTSLSTFLNGVMSNTSASTMNLGVADTTASSGTVVNVDYAGVAVALTTGTVVVGDLLVSTVTWPGYLVTNNSASAGAVVGTALVSEASTASGLNRILLHH